MWFKYPETFKPLPKQPDAKIVSITIGGATMKIE
jgi:hypothetical protein|nr:MAG: hypothetical protein [Bacteriophage sp.]